MAHGYLLCSFLSPFSNHRTDAYGGDLTGRSRFCIEVLRSVRRRVGPDYPIICRLSGDEYVEGGLKIDETCRIACLLELNGADALHISACNAVSGYLNHPPYYVEECVFVPLAEAVEAVVKIPVITVGRIKDPAAADRIIRDGKADLVSMGRALIADPRLPEKARAGHFDEITPVSPVTVACNTSGREACAAPSIRKRDMRKRPVFKNRSSKADLDRRRRTQAALRQPRQFAAGRGHQVTLFEKTHLLGGKMRLAAVPPKKDVLLDFVAYLERRVRTAGVQIELGKTLTAAMVEEGKPDAVIVASGAVPTSFRTGPAWRRAARSPLRTSCPGNRRRSGRGF